MCESPCGDLAPSTRLGETLGECQCGSWVRLIRNSEEQGTPNCCTFCHSFFLDLAHKTGCFTLLLVDCYFFLSLRTEQGWKGRPSEFHNTHCPQYIGLDKHKSKPVVSYIKNSVLWRKHGLVPRTVVQFQISSLDIFRVYLMSQNCSFGCWWSLDVFPLYNQ